MAQAQKRKTNLTYSIWINQNYVFLQGRAKRYCYNQWDALLSLFVIYLEKNWDRKYQPMTEEGRLKFTQVWFKNMIKWKNSQWNIENRVNDFMEDWTDQEYEYDQQIELQAETDRDDIKEWLLDLNQNHDELNFNRLVRLRQIYLTLDTHEKVLYDLYFTKELSLRDIGKQLNLPHMSVYAMINELKQKIKDNYGLDNN